MPQPSRPVDDAVVDASRDPSADPRPLTRRELRDGAAGRRPGPRRGLPTLRLRPALALAACAVLAGVGTGALSSSLSAGPDEPTEAVVAAASSEGAGTRENDRASRSEERDGASDELGEHVAPPVTVSDDESADAEDPDLVDTVVVPAGLDEADLAAGLLSTTVPTFASGVYDVVPGEVEAPGSGDVVTVRVRVEQGLDVDGEKFADQVLATLNDPRGWGADGSLTFARTAGDTPTLTVTLASPDSVDALCAPLDTGGLWSCGQTGHAVLNHLRWVEGSGVYGDDMVSYRQYLVNHEVGHVLGHRHATCGASGDLAPVMVQQSGAAIRCVPNGWPNP